MTCPIREQERRLAEKSAALDSAQRTIADGERRLAESAAALDERDSRIEALRLTVDDKDRRIEALLEQLRTCQGWTMAAESLGRQVLTIMIDRNHLNRRHWAELRRLVEVRAAAAAFYFFSRIRSAFLRTTHSWCEHFYGRNFSLCNACLESSGLSG